MFKCLKSFSEKGNIYEYLNMIKFRFNYLYTVCIEYLAAFKNVKKSVITGRRGFFSRFRFNLSRSVSVSLKKVKTLPAITAKSIFCSKLIIKNLIKFSQILPFLEAHRNKMKHLIFCSLIILIIFGLCDGQEKGSTTEKPYLPCPGCAMNYKPVCAKPVAGGPAKTYHNSCFVQALDCGHSEERE